MSKEKTKNTGVQNNRVVNDLLMKPFSLGWTREVVKRLITNSKTPNCDVYYFNPSKKKLRSMSEVKLNLSDELTPECFSFKREPLGLSSDLEVVRDAKVRRKGTKKRKNSNSFRKEVKHENEEEVTDNEKELKKIKVEKEDKDIKPDAKTDIELVENEEKSDTSNSKENEEKEESENKPEIKLRRAKSNIKQPDESKTFNSKKKTKTKAKSAKSPKSIRLQPVKKRKGTLRELMNAKQAKKAKLVDKKKVLKKIVSKKVVSLKEKLPKIKLDKKSALNTKKNNAVKLKTAKKSVKKSETEEEVAKESETNENDKESAASDLKSIVEKNIVKYREMREKQKLGLVKTQGSDPSKKISLATVSKFRLEPISKNKSFYIKPIEKGWRRELVYRTNCAKGGQMADVYYFHPSGKKLRSFREISENLTHGLTIECFTFRKEPIGFGEPSEIIRNARPIQKN